MWGSITSYITRVNPSSALWPLHSNVWTFALAFCASAVKWDSKKHYASLLKIVSWSKTCISVIAVQHWRQELFAVCCIDAPSCLHLTASEVPIAVSPLKTAQTACHQMCSSGTWDKCCNEKCNWTVPLQPQCLTNYCPFIIIYTEKRHK